MDIDEQIAPYAAAVRKLLRGPVYFDDTVWLQIRDYEQAIGQYLANIGLGLLCDQQRGFAYLHDASRDEDGKPSLPALVNRRNLSLRDTVLLVLLRERFGEHERRDLDGSPLTLSEDELLEMMIIFMGEQPDESQVVERCKRSITHLVDSGFLKKRLSDGHFIVRPIIWAKIGTDELQEIKALLAAHVTQNAQEEDNEEPTQ